MKELPHEGPLYIVGLADATRQFIEDLNSVNNKANPVQCDEVWLDTVLEDMVAHFEYQSTAIESYHLSLFGEDMGLMTEQDRINRLADLESLLEFGKKVFTEFKQSGLYSDDGELLGRYLQVHGAHAVVLCHYPDPEAWREL